MKLGKKKKPMVQKDCREWGLGWRGRALYTTANLGKGGGCILFAIRGGKREQGATFFSKKLHENDQGKGRRKRKGKARMWEGKWGDKKGVFLKFS